MKTYTSLLVEALAPKHLLKHPFYQAWSAGELPMETLRTYARQYYHHVAAFPRYISATHSLCDRIEDRQILLDNLVDEEQGVDHHPELWLRFAESLGETREQVKAEKLKPETQALLDTFDRLARSSYAEGLGSLFAYEHQVPEVASSKIDGLKKFYGVENQRGLQFFDVHLKADVYHSEACAGLLDRLSEKDQVQARAAAGVAAESLWRFLDGMQHSCSS